MKTLQLSDYKMLLSKWSSFYNFLLKAIWSLIIKDLSSSLRETFARLFQYTNNKVIFYIKTFKRGFVTSLKFSKWKNMRYHTKSSQSQSFFVLHLTSSMPKRNLLYNTLFNFLYISWSFFYHFSLHNSFNSFSSHVKRKQIKERNLSTLLEDAS